MSRWRFREQNSELPWGHSWYTDPRGQGGGAAVQFGLILCLTGLENRNRGPTFSFGIGPSRLVTGPAMGFLLLLIGPLGRGNKTPGIWRAQTAH